MTLTWKQFSDLALATNGLLADLLDNPDDPNSVLNTYGLDEISAEDVDRWKETLASTATTPTQKEILQYIASLLPDPDSDRPIANEVPPTW